MGNTTQKHQNPRVDIFLVNGPGWGWVAKSLNYESWHEVTTKEP